MQILDKPRSIDLFHFIFGISGSSSECCPLERKEAIKLGYIHLSHHLINSVVFVMLISQSEFPAEILSSPSAAAG